jgi:hypothetical protein
MYTSLAEPKEKRLSSLKSSDSKKRIQRLIDSHATPEGYIDIRSIAKDLNIQVFNKDHNNSTIVVELFLQDDGKTRQMNLSTRFSEQEINCAISWVLSEYLINYNTIYSRSLTCNVFQLREFRRNRYSRSMLLATRLAMTEDTISKMSELDNHKLQKQLSPFITTEFANAVVKGHSVSFLISNDYI